MSITIVKINVTGFHRPVIKSTEDNAKYLSITPYC
jgi:hypothetical protein